MGTCSPNGSSGFRVKDPRSQRETWAPILFPKVSRRLFSPEVCWAAAAWTRPDSLPIPFRGKKLLSATVPGSNAPATRRGRRAKRCVPAPHRKNQQGQEWLHSHFFLPPFRSQARNSICVRVKSGRNQQQVERRQQSLLHIASGLRKVRVQDIIEREDAQQQRGEFGEFQ